MTTAISVLIVLVCIAIVGIVVIQNPKGGGITSGLGSVNQIAGVKQMTDGVERVTWILAVILFVLCLASAAFFGKGKATAKEGDPNYNSEANPETTIQVENTGVNVGPPTTPATPGQ